MTFKWYVKPKPGADANTTADMKALNSTLGGLASNRSFATITKDNIVRNVEYEIVVKVTNFVGQSSEGSLRVTRKNDAVPEVELSSTGVKMQRSQRLLLRGTFLNYFFTLVWLIFNGTHRLELSFFITQRLFAASSNSPF